MAGTAVSSAAIILAVRKFMNTFMPHYGFILN
jgi:hypothetical protein